MRLFNFFTIILLSAVPVVSSAYDQYGTGGSVDGFVGYQHDLDLKMSTKLKEVPKNGSGTYLGLSVSYSSEYFVLNTFVKASTLDGEKAEVMALSLTRAFALGKNELGITVGDMVIPFGLYEIQRLYPTVLSQRTLNDSVFSAVADSSIVNPTNVGVMAIYTVDTITFTAAAYLPDPENFVRIKSDFARIRFDQDFQFVGGLDQVVPGVNGGPSVDLRGFDAGQPESFVEPTEVTIDTITVIKRSVFFGLTFDDREDFLVDFEAVLSKGKTDDSSIGIDEQYYYVGMEKIFNKLSLKAEAARFISESARRSELGAYGLGVSYDTGETVYIASYVESLGVLQGTDMSVGLIHHLGNNVFVKVLYRTVDATLKKRRFEVENRSCFSTVEQECEDPSDGLILPERQTEGAEFEQLKNRGIEVRLIWFF